MKSLKTARDTRTMRKKNKRQILKGCLRKFYAHGDKIWAFELNLAFYAKTHFAEFCLNFLSILP